MKLFQYVTDEPITVNTDDGAVLNIPKYALIDDTYNDEDELNKFILDSIYNTEFVNSGKYIEILPNSLKRAVAVQFHSADMEEVYTTVFNSNIGLARLNDSLNASESEHIVWYVLADMDYMEPDRPVAKNILIFIVDEDYKLIRVEPAQPID